MRHLCLSTQWCSEAWNRIVDECIISKTLCDCNVLQQKLIGVTYIANWWRKLSLQIDYCNISLKLTRSFYDNSQFVNKNRTKHFPWSNLYLFHERVWRFEWKTLQNDDDTLPCSIDLRVVNDYYFRFPAGKEKRVIVGLFMHQCSETLKFMVCGQLLCLDAL